MEKLLVSGEFWHSDFADLIGRVEVPTTLIPGDRLSALSHSDDHYSAILIAQSRRGSVSQTFINHCRRLFPETPVIVLLGSWCEGETRSGTPLQHVVRMYWHEWNGSYRALSARLAAQGMPLPGPSSKRPLEIVRQSENTGAVAAHAACEACLNVVAVSAMTLCQFETLEDPLRALGAAPIWLEQAAWRAATPEEVSAVILDCDGISPILRGRMELVCETLPGSPIFLCLNFPRKDEIAELRQGFEIAGVISKPFDLHALWSTLQAAGLELAEPIATPRARPVEPGVSLASPASR